MAKTKKKQVRAADPEAIRATVYFTPELHESMRLATVEARKAKGAARVPGPRLYDRITLSAMIGRACQLFIEKKYPQFKS